MSDYTTPNEQMVSAIIVTKNRLTDLRECIKSLFYQTTTVNELIIVDGSNNDLTSNYIEHLAEDKCNIDIRYVKQSVGGMAHARNIGIDYSTGDIILFIDDDVILNKEYIAQIISTFNADYNGKIGGVGGKAYERPRRGWRILGILYSIVGVITLRDSIKKGSVTIAGLPARLPDKPSYVQWLDGKNMAYRKVVFNMFRDDEMLERLSTYAYYEDFDLSYNISKKYKLFLNTQAKSLHNNSQVTRIDLYNTYYIKIQNHFYLVNKYSFNKTAFYYSAIGLLIVRAILLTIKPCQKNYSALKGLIDGLLNILKHNNPIETKRLCSKDLQE